MPESMPASSDEARPETAAEDGSAAVVGPLTDPRAFQILSTEHLSLLTARSLAYNESFSRAGMFLTFLSATLIVIGFLLGSQSESSVTVPAVVILLLADLYIGAATVGRLLDANREELTALRGMNRIRHAYHEMVPGLEDYFVTSRYDDAASVLSPYGETIASASILRSIVHGLTTAIGMVGTIDAMIFGALVGLVAVGLGAPAAVAVGSAVAGFLVGLAIFAAIGTRWALRLQSENKPRFPAPGSEPD